MKLGRSSSLDSLLSTSSNSPLTNTVNRFPQADNSTLQTSTTFNHQHQHYGPFLTYCGRSMIDQSTQTPNNWSQISWMEDYCAATTKANTVNTVCNDSSPIYNGAQCKANHANMEQRDYAFPETATALPDIRQLVLEKKSISLISPLTSQTISKLPPKQQSQFSNQLQQTDSISSRTCWNQQCSVNQSNLISLKRLTKECNGVSGAGAISNSLDRIVNSHNSHNNNNINDDDDNNDNNNNCDSNNYYEQSKLIMETNNTNNDDHGGGSNGDGNGGDKTNDDYNNCGQIAMTNRTSTKLTSTKTNGHGNGGKPPPPLHTKSPDYLSNKLNAIGSDVAVTTSLFDPQKLNGQIIATKSTTSHQPTQQSSNATKESDIVQYYCDWKRGWNASQFQDFSENDWNLYSGNEVNGDGDGGDDDDFDVNIFGCDYDDEDTENNQNNQNSNNEHEMFRKAVIGSGQSNGKAHCNDLDGQNCEENFCNISTLSYYECLRNSNCDDEFNNEPGDDNNKCDYSQDQDSASKPMPNYSKLHPLPKSMPISIPKANQSNKSCTNHTSATNYLDPHQSSLTAANAANGTTSNNNNCVLSFNSTDEFNQEIADLMQKDKMEQCRLGKPNRIANLDGALGLEQGRCAPVAELFGVDRFDVNPLSAHIKAQHQHKLSLLKNCCLRSDCNVQDLDLHSSCSPFSYCDDDNDDDNANFGDKQTLNKRVLDSYQDRWLLDEEYSLLDQRGELCEHSHKQHHLSSHTKCVKLDNELWPVLPSPKMISSNIFNSRKTETIENSNNETKPTEFESNYRDSPDNIDFAVSNNLLIEFLQQQQQNNQIKETVCHRLPHFPKSPLKSEFILKPSYRSAFLPVSSNVSFRT